MQEHGPEGAADQTRRMHAVHAADRRAGEERNPLIIDRQPKRGRRIAAVACGVVVSLAALSAVWPESDENPGAGASPAAAEGACPESWAVVQLSNENSRVVGEGVPSIYASETDEQGRAASKDWFKLIKADPEALAGNANTFNAALGRNTNYTAEQLSDGTCMTDLGEQAAAELESALGISAIAPDVAPHIGFNTGVDANGNMVVAAHPGISGNRKAIKITLPNGNRIWVMARCGNVVTVTDKPPLPEGPTDQPEPPKNPVPTTTPRPQPTVPTTLARAKGDDTAKPGDGTPASQDRSSGDAVGVGQGPAGQPVNEEGRVPGDVQINTNKDDDGDGISNGADACPAEKETANGFEDGDGCPDVRPTPPTSANTNVITGEQEEAPAAPVTTIAPQPNSTTPPTPAP